jgi:hypothetical protein
MLTTTSAREQPAHLALRVPQTGGRRIKVDDGTMADVPDPFSR